MAAHYAIQLNLRAEPAHAVTLIRGAVREAGGVIVEATRFSNKALSFKVDCYAKSVAALVGALHQLGTVHEAIEQPRGAPKLATLPGDSETLVLIHVQLVHGLPDERIELPKVPG